MRPRATSPKKATEHGIYTYGYDDLYRITDANNPILPDEAYTYDKLGNRLTSSQTTGNWTYNANNELQGYDDVSFSYDLNGNLSTKTKGVNATQYSYDVEDRLSEVRDGSNSLIASYYYDPFGRRLWKDVDGTKTYFLYSDEGLVGEYDATGQEIKTYGWASGSIWGTNPLFVKKAGIYYWYQNDAQGTPQKIIAGNGSVVWSATYDSFGNCQVDIETIVNNLRMPGQYFDAETGLHYNLQRYYDPTTGRYLRTDPFGDGLNLYAYCFNNPNSLIDPMGLCAVNNAWGWWSDVAVTAGDYWSDKAKSGWNSWSNAVTVDFDPVVDAAGKIGHGIGKAVVEGARGAKKAVVQSKPGWVMAGKVAVATHTVVAVKAYALYDVATGGPVTIAATTQVLYRPQETLDFIQGLFPATPPAMTKGGVLGYAVGRVLEEIND
ncbi:MAG: RHS domain-containing protein [Deltaproteobacteria bacterium]|nr:RHS domain-containing protein [Deltaproteobacteria bacterium]